MIKRTDYNDDALFYTPNTILSCKSPNRNVFVIQSIRNLGKSYGMMKVIKRDVENGVNAVWSRWNDEELSVAINEAFDTLDIQTKENPEGEWLKTVINKSAVIFENIESHGRLYFLSVKMAHKLKGLDIKSLHYWVYDEFIPEFYENETRRIEETQKWNSLYITLKRTNTNFTAVLISNCISWFNGYFEQWGILPFPIGEIRTYDQKTKILIGDEIIETTQEIVVENVKPTKAQIKRIMIDEVVKGSSCNLKNYLENTTKDNFSLIATCPGDVPLHNAEWYYNKECYSFRMYEGIMYWTKARPRDVHKWTCNKADITDEIRRDKAMGVTFEKYYDSAKMRFKDGNVHNAVLGMIWASRRLVN